jgi:ferredoxin-NADP reductase
MRLKLLEKKPEVQNVTTFIFEPEKPVVWQPGQYMHYLLPHPEEDDRGTARWFTISSPPYEKRPSITTRFDTERSSTFKKALRKLEVGQEIESDDGPKGTFVLDEGASRHYFIAGGIGITPFHSILKQLDHDNKSFNIELLYANRDQVLVFGDELHELEKKHSDFHVHKFLDGKRIDEAALKMCAEDDKCIFYLSGPRPMVETYEHMLKDMGVAEQRIKLDYFPGYN